MLRQPLLVIFTRSIIDMPIQSGGLRLDIHIQVDGAVFSADIVARTAHRYTGECFVEVHAAPRTINVNLRAFPGRPLPPDIEGRFRNDLLDDRLRASVEAQTSELHGVLARAALHESLRPNVP